ncbi:MAG: flagellar basal body L-ring protein FlgH [Pseudomonadota bacterium]|nr:flagellar basal body L-ring protein FlgH [Pseudomonadota bacterium]
MHPKQTLPLLAVFLLCGCSAVDRLASIGQAPKLTAIENPVEAPDYRTVSLPMPEIQSEIGNPNSLWSAGRRSFFKDQRATEVGDLITVLIEIDDDASMSNESTRSRANSEEAGLDNLLGIEGQLSKVFPEAVDNASLVGMDSAMSNKGKGAITRGEKINLKVAAIVTQILPNGNMVVHGRQEVRVNYEVRELQIAGIIRAEDISTSNTIGYEKIAEARISYGGRGHISDVQQPRYGQQVFDIVFPF